MSKNTQRFQAVQVTQHVCVSFVSRIRLAHDQQVKAMLGPEAGAESDVHVFNSFFYKMLGQSKKRDG